MAGRPPAIERRLVWPDRVRSLRTDVYGYSERLSAPGEEVGPNRDPHVGLVDEPGSYSVESEEVRCRRGCAVDHGDYVASRIGEPNPVAEPPKMSKSFVSSLAGQAEECFTETSISVAVLDPA